MKALLAFFLCLTSASAATPQEQIAARAGLDQKLNAQVPLHAVFRDEHGRRVELGSFFGKKPVILALAYYECPNLCTLVLNGILQTAHELKFDAGKDYEIVVVSFDPREQPALAAAKKQTYIERYGRAGAAAGWHFLVGDKDSIAELASAVGYRFAYDEATRQFAHPSTMIVLTPDGKVARYFPGIEYPPRDVRLALIDASREQIGSLADRVFLLCFHYNPQTGRYGLLITRTMQFAGIATVLAVGAYIVLNVRRERRATF
ncbi:MAG TPA: SCO family protein [Chthoniobacterales bacterium]|nr:SCO family protein [Chthoniobacterales bacterium]